MTHLEVKTKRVIINVKSGGYYTVGSLYYIEIGWSLKSGSKSYNTLLVDAQLIWMFETPTVCIHKSCKITQ